MEDIDFDAGFMDSLRHDLRLGLRVIRRTITTGLVTVLCLAIGAAANMAMFSVVQALLSRD